MCRKVNVLRRQWTHMLSVFLQTGMSSTNMDSLRALEALMNEFFHPTTTNERKREIERVLNQFGDQENSWSDSLEYLSHTNNEFTSMFCLSVVESSINKKWSNFGTRKAEVKNCLWKYLMEKEKSVPLYIVNKTAKLIVNIARLDWPHSYPDFFSSVYQLIENKSTVSLGLTLLEIAIEELTVLKEDIASERKEELHKLLLGQTQQILNILASVLENTLDKHINIVTATPPPSPTHSHYQNQGADVINTAFEMSLKRGLDLCVPHMDLDSLRLASQALRCVSHLFAWLPLNQHQQISHSLLAAIFVCATFGYTNGHALSKELDISNLGTLAMCCINEIMSKNCISNDATEFFYHLFQNTFQLLQTLIKETNGGKVLIDDLSEDYVAKFTDFLRLFIGNHFPRYECHQSFPTVEFLNLLFQFTFKQTSCERFLSSLEIWNLFLDFVHSRKKLREANNVVDVAKYSETLIALLSEVMRKFQFKINSAFLEELDNENLDDDDLSEWQKFISQCIETIAKISELLPGETYELVNSCLEENLKNYVELEYFASKAANGVCNKLELTSETDLQKLHCSLRDLSTVLKITGRLAVNFTGEHFTERFSVAKPIVEKLVHTTAYSGQRKYSYLRLHVKQLEADFRDVHCQLFGALQAFVYWLAQYGNKCISEEISEFNLLLTTVVTHCVEIVCDTSSGIYPSVVVHGALLCLQSVTTTVRSQAVFAMDSTNVLYTAVCNSANSSVTGTHGQVMKCLTLPVNIPDEYILCNVISNIFLLPWVNVSDANQEWTQRSHHHSVFIQSLITPYLSLAKVNAVRTNVGSAQAEFQIVLKRTLSMLTNMVYNHSESPTRSKQILFANIHGMIEECISLLPVYLAVTDVGELLLRFLLSTFDSLQNQMKRDYVERTINSMLNLFSESGKAGLLMNDCSNSRQLMKEFFEIFSLIAKQPGASYKALLPSMLSLALNQLYPFISHSNLTDLSSAFYGFLYQFLLNNFKFFFKSNLVNSLNGTESKDTQHEEEFLKVMQIYGQSFLQSDLVVFKENLEALESLNYRFKLYHKHSFQTTLWKQFLTLFMQTLVSKSYDLLNEEICTVIYNLASVDFNIFLNNFIPEFLCNTEGLSDNQRSHLGSAFLRNFATDLPSFTVNVQKFVNDYRYYRLCNHCL